MGKRKGKANTWRNVPERDRIILWGRSAARCCFPDCRIVLIEPATDLDAEATFGQAAHIVAHSDGGPRADTSLPRDKLDRYENLLLLCGNHHTIVDRQPNTYTVADLRAWKLEHEAWVVARTEPTRNLSIGWSAIAQEDSPQIDLASLPTALSPDFIRGELLHLSVSHRTSSWDEAAKKQKSNVEQFIEKIPAAERRLAVFSLTRIPLAIQLGFVISDRCRVALYQYHRDTGSWAWPQTSTWVPDFAGPTWKDIEPNAAGPVVMRVSLSAEVNDRFVSLVGGPIADVHLTVARPSVTWLREPEQLQHLSAQYRGIFESLRQKYGERCTSVHVLYAGPTGGAIALGRAINPRMSPPVHLYEYADNTYEAALVLEGS